MFYGTSARLRRFTFLPMVFNSWWIKSDDSPVTEWAGKLRWSFQQTFGLVWVVCFKLHAVLREAPVTFACFRSMEDARTWLDTDEVL